MTPTSTLKTLRFFGRRALQYPKHVIALIILLPITILLQQFIPPLIAARVLDDLSSNSFQPGNFWGQFGSEIMLYAGLLIVSGIILWRVIIVLIWQLESKVTRDIANMCFDQLMKLDTTFHANSFGGSLVSQTNKLSASYIRVADTMTFQVYVLLISLILTTIILGRSAPLVVALFWVVTVIYAVAAVYFTTQVRALTTKEAMQQTKVTGALADAVTNVAAVKSFATFSLEQLRFRSATKKSQEATARVIGASTVKDLYASSFTTSLQIAALAVAVLSVVQFNAAASTVFVVFSYGNLLAQKLWELQSQALRNLNRAVGDSHEAITMLSLQSAIADPVHPERAQMSHGAISFKDVTFGHDGNTGDKLFQNFNLTIKQGEKIGLVGHSGSGKTSLTKLLLRFNDVNSGAITIDGQDISHVTQDDLRKSIAYVPQEPMLFHRSIRENIAYGKHNATEDEITAAAIKAHAHEFITELPDGYDTLVGERGVKLSGGQRQRIAIARAILKDAPVLVLDEATSALDSESESLIQDALWKLMQNRTAIIVAHRLSTIQKMDRIIVMEDGAIIEDGTHQQLLQQNGQYAKLWAHQSGGFLED